MCLLAFWLTPQDDAAAAGGWYGSISSDYENHAWSDANPEFRTDEHLTATYIFHGETLDNGTSPPTQWWQPAEWRATIDRSDVVACGDGTNNALTRKGSGSNPAGKVLIRFRDDVYPGRWAYSISAAADDGATFTARDHLDCPPPYNFDYDVEVRPAGADIVLTGQPECSEARTCWVPLPAGQTPEQTTTLQGSGTVDLPPQAENGSQKLAAEWSLTREPKKCNNGLDDDGDGHIDFVGRGEVPADPGCSAGDDDSELGPDHPRCDNGEDDDGDGLIDYNADGSGDPGCTGPDDDDESLNVNKCDNGADDDHDGFADYPADPGCISAEDDDERGTAACDNGSDDDGDGWIDFAGGDAGCVGPADLNETGRCEDEPGAQFGFATKTYAARAVINNAPDLDLFRFSPSVRYCYTDTTAEMLSASTLGDIHEWSVDTFLLELLGFAVRYDASEETSFTLGNRATIRGDFDVHFDWLVLFGLVSGKKGVKIDTVLRKQFKAKFAKRVAKLLSKNQYDEFDKFLVWGIAKQRAAVIAAFEKQLARLDRLPLGLDEVIRDKVLGTVNGVLDRYERILKAELSSKDFGKLTADLVGDIMVDAAEKAVGELLPDLPNDFSLWSPNVEATVSPGGVVAWFVGGFENPYMEVTDLGGSDTRSAPTEVRTAAARKLATDLRLDGLKKPGGQTLRVPGETGTTTVEVLTPGVVTAAARRRAKSLARGVARFATTGWKNLKLRPSSLGRKTFKRARRLKVIIRVTTKPPRGRAAVTTLTTTLK